MVLKRIDNGENTMSERRLGGKLIYLCLDVRGSHLVDLCLINDLYLVASFFTASTSETEFSSS
jgi:hypothetical protein